MLGRIWLILVIALQPLAGLGVAAAPRALASGGSGGGAASCCMTCCCCGGLECGCVVRAPSDNEQVPAAPPMAPRGQQDTQHQALTHKGFEGFRLGAPEGGFGRSLAPQRFVGAPKSGAQAAHCVWLI